MEANCRLLVSVLAVFLCLCACGRPPAATPAPPPGVRAGTPLSVAEVRQGGVITNGCGDPADDRSIYVWDEERIRARHETIMMVPLPGYAEEVKGRGGYPSDIWTYATWTFHIPRAHLEDFKKYILGLGVPERCLAKKGKRDTTTMEYSEPGWALPDPPATKLFFLRTDAQPGESTEKWIKGETMFYYLLNPNINDRSIEIMFSAQTGWVRVSEFHHHD